MRPTPTVLRWRRFALAAVVGLLLPGCGFLASRVEVRTTAAPKPVAIDPAGLPQLEESPGQSSTSTSSTTSSSPNEATTTVPAAPVDPGNPDPTMVNFIAGLDPQQMSEECRADYQVWFAVVDLVRLETYTEFEETSYLIAMDRAATAAETARPLQPAADRHLMTEMQTAFRGAADRMVATRSERASETIFDQLLKANATLVTRLTKVAGRRCPQLIALP